jgi:hypothetical protein
MLAVEDTVMHTHTNTTTGHPSRSWRRRLRLTAVLAASALTIGGFGIAGAAPTPPSRVSASDADVYVSVSPRRVLDTRNGTPLAAKEVRTLSFADSVPPEATAVAINTTTDRPAGQTYITIWPTGEAMPVASVNNAQPGVVTPNTVTARLGANSSINIYNDSDPTDLIVDVAGYYLPVSQVDGLGGAGTPGPTGPAGADGAALGSIIDTSVAGLPVAALSNTTFQTVTSFVAPADGAYLLAGSIDVTFLSNPTLAAGLAASAICRWDDGRDIERGATITANVSVIGIGLLPGLNRANLYVPGAVANATAGQAIDLQCRADQSLALGSELQVSAAYSVIQVADLG